MFYFLGKYIIDLGEYSIYESNFISELTKFVPLFSESYVEYFNTWLKNKVSEILFPDHSVDIENMLSGDETYWGLLDSEERNKRARSTGMDDHTGIDESALLRDYYTQIVELTIANNIKIIGVQYPVEPEYLRQSPEKSRKMMDAYFRNLAWDQFFDFSNLFSQPDYFSNEDHMNSKGAKKFLSELDKRRL